MTNWKLILFGVVTAIIALLVLRLFIPKAGASAVPKITWCHVEPNGNQETLELPQAALEQAGHVDANGNPLHAGDHAGACIEPTPSCTPTPIAECEDCVTPSPTVVQEETPTVTPTDAPSASPHGDGLSDHRSDGRSDGKAPGAPNTGFDPYPRSSYDGSVVGYK